MSPPWAESTRGRSRLPQWAVIFSRWSSTSTSDSSSHMREAPHQADREGTVVEAIRDQWVIVVAVVALAILVAWLFVAWKR